jgi:hypothetical protein
MEISASLWLNRKPSKPCALHITLFPEILVLQNPYLENPFADAYDKKRRIKIKCGRVRLVYSKTEEKLQFFFACGTKFIDIFGSFS